MKAHGELFTSLTNGEKPHAYPDRWPQPVGFRRSDDLAVCLLLHYPRYGGAPYFDSAGHAVDQTLLIVERAVQAAHPNVNDLVFAQMFDFVADLYPGGAPIGFDYEKDFYKHLSESNKTAWKKSQVGALAAMFVDEMVQRERVGAIVVIAGNNPTRFWPELLNAALPIALAEAARLLGRDVEFEIRYLSDLPPLDSGPNGEPAPALSEKWLLEHPSTANSTMASDRCRRWDAAIGVAFGVPSVAYFARLKKSHGEYNALEMGMLQADAKVRYCSLTLTPQVSVPLALISNPNPQPQPQPHQP